MCYLFHSHLFIVEECNRKECACMRVYVRVCKYMFVCVCACVCIYIYIELLQQAAYQSGAIRF